MPKISIIVPVYNTADYLEKCFNSILAQTFTEFEVVVVDDGSIDDSPAICDRYAAKDSRFRIIHKQNEGVSVARNTALSHVKGEYLCFVDSDDTISIKMLEEMYRVLCEQNADIVQSYDFVSSENSQTLSILKTYSRQEALEILFSFNNEIKPSLCLSLYRFDLFRDVHFPADIHHYEDFAIQAIVLNRINKLVRISKSYYIYNQRVGSANHSGMNTKIWSCLKINDYLKFESIPRTKKMVNNTVAFFIATCFFCCIFGKATEKDGQQLRNVIKTNVKSLLLSNVPKFRIRLFLLAYLCLPKVVEQLTRYRLKGKVYMH